MSRRLTSADIDQRLIDSGKPINLVRYGSSMKDNSSLWECHKCSHQWTTTGNDILNSGNKCPKCTGNMKITTDIIEERLVRDNRPILLIWYAGKVASRLSQWKCTKCDHEWATSANNVINRGNGCLVCSGNMKITTDIIEERLITGNRTITILWYAGHSHDPTSRWKCTKCDHEWNTRASHIFGKHESGCPKCHGAIKLTTDIIEERLVRDNRPILLIWYAGHSNDRTSRWKCTKCDHEWNNAATSITNGIQGCPNCAIPGFKTSKPAYFYLHQFDDFIKIGITNNYKQRKTQLNNQTIDDVTYKIIRSQSWYFNQGGDAYIAESMILDGFNRYQYDGLLTSSFDGRTELLDISLYDDIVNLLEYVTK